MTSLGATMRGRPISVSNTATFGLAYTISRSWNCRNFDLLVYY